MSDFLYNFAHLVSNLLAFIAGVACTLAYCWLHDRWKDRSEPWAGRHRTRFRSLTLLWVLIFVIAGYDSAQQYSTASDLKHLAAKTAGCQRDFFDVLKRRSDANDETDNWSAKKTEAIANWMHEITFPPANIIAHREVRDQVYQQWLWDTTGKYFALIDQADQEQKDALKRRQELVLPEPTCAK